VAQPPASARPTLREIDLVDTPQDSKIAMPPPSGAAYPHTSAGLSEQTQSSAAAPLPDERPLPAPSGLPSPQYAERAAYNSPQSTGTERAGISVEIYDTGIQPPQHGAVESQAAVSIPVIRQLDKGSYYIQLGIYGTPAALQEAVVKIPATYPLLTQSLGNTAKSSYRLLVGPLNEGESNASLLYFRRYGYKDAFIRKN
jgi:hypothetical protein